jgi:hypothetical protein
MGHITNPIGFRVGRTSSWSSLWSSDKSTYANNWIIDYSFSRYFEFLFKKFNCLIYKKGFIFSHVELYKYSKFYLLKVYVYNSNLMLLHKGRFFYFWRRLSILRDSLIKRLVVSYMKNSYLNMNFSPIFYGIVQRRLFLNNNLFKEKLLLFKTYLKKSNFFYQKLFFFFTNYPLGLGYTFREYSTEYISLKFFRKNFIFKENDRKKLFFKFFCKVSSIKK